MLHMPDLVDSCCLLGMLIDIWWVIESGVCSFLYFYCAVSVTESEESGEGFGWYERKNRGRKLVESLVVLFSNLE